MDITKKIGFGIGLFGFAVSAMAADGWDPGSQANAINGITDSRHNMTMSYNANHAVMDLARNDYGEVCVYCHTPHGANTQINAPLWNRTINSPSNYTIYDKPTTLMQPIGAPGPSSLTCLSCHDGTIAIDSVLNMPGSGLTPTGNGGRNSEIGTGNQPFLNQWAIAGFAGPPPLGHFTLGPELGNGATDGTCALCHIGDIGVGSFNAFMLGTDLRDEHPIGVLYPIGNPDADFNGVADGLNIVSNNKMAFFDLDGDNRADPNEVRMYDTGEGPEVECASCHDPHGVPSDGPGSRFNPSFLRVNNGIGGTPTTGNANITSHGGSALCLTCHTK